MTEKQIINSLKNYEVDIAQAKGCFLACEVVFHSYVISDAFFGVNFQPPSLYLYNRHSIFTSFIFKKNLAAVDNKIYSDYLKNPESLNKRTYQHRLLTEKLDNVWQKYKRMTNGESDKNLLRIFQSIVKISKEWWLYGFAGESKGDIINSQLVPQFAQRHGVVLSRAQEIFAILSYPARQPVFIQERRDFLNICLFIDKNKKLRGYLFKSDFGRLLADKKTNERLKDYLKKYFWAKTDFYQAIEITSKSLLAEIKKEVQKSQKRGILDELKKIQKVASQIKQKGRKLLVGLRLSEEDKKDIDFAKKMIAWVEERKEGMMRQWYYFLSILAEIADEFDISYKESSVYLLKEVENLLKYGRKVKWRELRRRDRGVFVVSENGKEFRLFYGKEARKLFELASQVKKTEIIKGMTASSGSLKKLQGIVRIILDPTKDKFREKEILVTSMTRTEFVPLMRKAKAIITNEGGIACHAAIVSREIGIPCLIGTKIATKVLKDGDLVEVDANKGVVRILKRK